MFRSAIVNLRCLVRYCRERPCIKWVLNLLVDWIKSCLNNSSPRNTEIFFLVEDKTNKRVRSLHSRSFSTLIASSSIVTLIEVNNSQKTLKCPKKKKITVIQPEDFTVCENPYKFAYQYWKDFNRPITKFYNRDDVNVIAAELRLTKTRPISFYKKHNLS